MTEPSNGSVSFEGRDILYTPNTDYCGQDVFTYTVTKSSGLCSDAARVTVTVPCPPGPCDENKWHYDSSNNACVRAISTSPSLGMVLYGAPSDCCAAVFGTSGGESSSECNVIDGCIADTPSDPSTPTAEPTSSPTKNPTAAVRIQKLNCHEYLHGCHFSVHHFLLPITLWPQPTPLPTSGAPTINSLPTTSDNFCGTCASGASMIASRGCTGFYFCVDGNPTSYQACPEGTKFSDSLVCDHDESAECSCPVGGEMFFLLALPAVMPSLTTTHFPSIIPT